MHDESDHLWLQYHRLISEIVPIRARIEEIISVAVAAEGDDPPRNLELLKRSFHQGYIATRLIEAGKSVGEAREQAASILEKPGFKTGYADSEKRTEIEERLYGNSRQQWSDTLRLVRHS